MPPMLETNAQSVPAADHQGDGQPTLHKGWSCYRCLLASGPTEPSGYALLKEQPLEPQLVDIAPRPFLAGLDRARDGMVGGAKVRDRMLVGRRVAAADIAALHAHSELRPAAAHLHAVVATQSARLDLADAIDVRARHWSFGVAHVGWRVHTAGRYVESIDGMGPMPRVDTTPAHGRAVQTGTCQGGAGLASVSSHYVQSAFCGRQRNQLAHYCAR